MGGVIQAAFETLREALVCAPILAYPNVTDDFIIDTDASGTAIGAELIQVQGYEERVISYGSFVLTPLQRKYFTTRLELLALVRFMREYRHYLLGRKFTVRTDHEVSPYTRYVSTLVGGTKPIRHGNPTPAGGKTW